MLLKRSRAKNVTMTMKSRAVGQNRPEAFHPLEIIQDPVENGENPQPEQDTDRAEEIHPGTAVPDLLRQAVVPE